MKTSNKILTIYGAMFAAVTFGFLGLNVREYRAAVPAMQECLEALQAGVGRPLVVVEAGTTVAFHPSDYGSFGAFSRGSDIVRARVSGDTLFVEGARYLSAPNSVRRIIRAGETMDVPPVEEWKGQELAY